MSGSILFLSKNLGAGNATAETRKTFTIKGFDSSFSTVIDDNLKIHQFKEYDKTTAPFIRLWAKNSHKDDFSIEIACLSIDFYADAVSMGAGFAAAWEGDDLERFQFRQIHYL